MKNWVRGSVLSLFLLTGTVAVGQNDFFFNHYMFNPSYYNPSWVASEDEAFLAAHHRTQWAGYSATLDPGSAPSTQLLSLVIPTKSIISGVGVAVVNDMQPSLRSNQVRFQLATSKAFRSGTLSFGISPAINIQTLDTDNFRPGDDREVFGEEDSQLKPNLHAGLLFKTSRDHFVGLSVENIIEPTFTVAASESVDYFPMNYLLLAGTEFGFTREIIVKPTLLVRSNLNSYTFELSAIAEYQDKLWGGVAFRRSESLSLLMGYSFLEDNTLKVGYSFDYVIQEQEAKEPTSHEIFLRYALPNLVFGGRKAVKTPRFTF